MQMPLPKEHWKSWRKETAETIHTKEVLINAAFLIHFAGKPEQLDKILYGDYLNECSFRDIDITRYEELGDLQGSALLKSEPSIRKAVQILLEKAEKDNLLYLELRWSPLNYIGELNAEQVLQCILEELEKGKPNIRKSLLLIASRHGNLNKIDDSIKLMKSMNNKELFVKYFRGFDLAGNESAHSPKELHDKFIDVLKECRNITIHAGETLPAESIWEAVYYLNAERIGHGLTLKNNVSLINKFLERKIGIEMCPSSNYQIKGFKDNYIPESYYEGVYPLKEYLDRELRVCVNTDNPGISRTSFTNELHRAARLTPGGLSLWDIFQLIHNGFLLAFYPYAEKKKMIKEAERIIGRLIKEEKL
jgi:adenosine deaminase